VPFASVILIVTAVMASLLEIIDTSIVNVAIPTMMGNLGTTLENISWVVTGYIISNAIVLPLAGWLSLRLGRKFYYTGCILLFTATSVGCGLAPNLWVLVVMRVFQGMAGGALLPTSQALIMEAFPKEKAGQASATFGMSVMIGPTIGPTLGGYLTDNYGWRSIFNINLPLGLAAAALSYLYVEDHKKIENSDGTIRKPPPIDYIGLILLIVGIGCLQYVLECGETDDWFSSKVIIVTTLAAVISIPSFIWWELHTEHPIVELSLFKITAIRYGTMIMGTVGSMLYSLIFFIPVFASSVLGLTATKTGELFIPGALASAAMMPFAGIAMKRVDPRVLIAAGFILFEIALLMLTGFSAQTSSDGMFNPLFVRGLAMAFLFVPINASVLSQFSGPKLGQAAGLMNLSRQIGGSIGIALYSTMFTIYRAQFRTDVSSHVSLLNPAAAQQFHSMSNGMGSKFGSAVGFTDFATVGLKQLYYRVERQVFVLGFDRVMWTMFFISGIALIPVFFLKTKGPVKAVDVH
jgi:DHA2 family multidrug resistance protein